MMVLLDAEPGCECSNLPCMTILNTIMSRMYDVLDFIWGSLTQYYFIKQHNEVDVSGIVIFLQADLIG